MYVLTTSYRCTHTKCLLNLNPRKTKKKKRNNNNDNDNISNETLSQGNATPLVCMVCRHICDTDNVWYIKQPDENSSRYNDDKATARKLNNACVHTKKDFRDCRTLNTPNEFYAASLKAKACRPLPLPFALSLSLSNYLIGSLSLSFSISNSVAFPICSLLFFPFGGRREEVRLPHFVCLFCCCKYTFLYTLYILFVYS